MRKSLFPLLCALLFALDTPISSAQTVPRLNRSIEKDPAYQTSLALFEEVYKTMLANYYKTIPVEEFKKFLYAFNQQIYPQLKTGGKSQDYIKWRSAAYMVEHLRDEEDVFSAFIPPQFVKQYEEKALGKKIDLGIEGEPVEQGFLVTFVEPRSDAYEKGLRGNDLLKMINGERVAGMAPEKIREMLVPLEGTSVTLEYFDAAEGKDKVIDVLSEEYFKQTVFKVPVDVPGIYALEIRKFNRRTAEDMTVFMEEILKNNARGLILDLRGNPGGPPLAAREISAFFLTPNEEFAYFQMNNKPKARLFVPEIPPEYRFKGDIVILVDEESGSASELFSGIMRGRNRAVLMGRTTAGQVMLKSMFHLEDGSMVLLVTARGHYPDGEVFSFDGLHPDEEIAEDSKDIDLIRYAAQYLASPPGGRANPR